MTSYEKSTTFFYSTLPRGKKEFVLSDDAVDLSFLPQVHNSGSIVFEKKSQEALAWLRGRVVVVSASIPENRGFEFRLGVKFLRNACIAMTFIT
jgi:hypothetical protein